MGGSAAKTDMPQPWASPTETLPLQFPWGPRACPGVTYLLQQASQEHLTLKEPGPPLGSWEMEFSSFLEPVVLATVVLFIEDPSCSL